MVGTYYVQGWGKTVIIGVEMHGSPLTLSPYTILRGRTITGSLFGGIKAKSDLPLLAQKYLDKVSVFFLYNH
jgi:S-(hydroxymethyl)glutathione dehydrogenase/alcohol dehydrogenase